MMQENAAASLLERRSGKSEGAFRTISEVAEELDVPQHVLRFWESRFSQIRPLKRGGNRRYYRPEDVDLLYRIRDLLYKEGYTIKGVQRILKGSGTKHVLDPAPGGTRKAVAQQDLSFDWPVPGMKKEEAVGHEAVAPSFPVVRQTSPAKTGDDAASPYQEKNVVQGELQDILSELLDLKKLLGDSLR